MDTLREMNNIGKTLAEQLNQIGISTPDDLMRIGSREAWLRIKAIDPSACINRLCALEGAVQGIRWHHLDDDTKASLKVFYNDHR